MTFRNSTRPEVEPAATTERGPGGASTTILKHPAYAGITASHVQGSTFLYGSDFAHQHFVTVSISRSELHRDLNRDWEFPREELIEVAMSEAQWVKFISSPNRGDTPCTLQRFQGELIPGLPRRDSTHIYSEEIKQKIADCVAALKQQRAALSAATSKLSKKAQEEVATALTIAIREIEANLPFVVESFNEHVEASMEKAKVEVNAYINNAITRAGLTALSGPAPLLLEGKDEK